MEMMSDEAAIQRVLHGDQQAFVHIVENYQQQIFMYCWRLLNQRQEAEDAVQDILVKAYQKLDTYKPHTSFSSWLYKIAYHHCLNVQRRIRFFQNILPLLRPEKDLSDSAEKEAEKYIFSEPLDRALRKLSPEERNLLVLRVFEEKSYVEIAQIMDKTSESVKKRYNRTLQKIKKWIIEREGEQHWEFIEVMWKRS
ncbi:MAG: RNA polymerase sigma factor [Bacillota bacterium]